MSSSVNVARSERDGHLRQRSICYSYQMRFFLMRSSETRPSLVVDTCAQINDGEIARFREELFNLGCANGLLFDPERCMILRESYSSLSADSIVVTDSGISTTDVLSAIGQPTASLEGRVERWLEILAMNWDSALPAEPAMAAPFLADIVPAASGSEVRALAAEAV